MNRINGEAVIKILILILFSLLFGSLIVTGDIKNYVHPRVIPFLIFSIGVMLIAVFLLIKDIRKPNMKKIRLGNYLIFIAPLLIFLYMNYFKNINEILQKSSNENIIWSEENKNISAIDNKFKISTNNFLTFLENSDDYINNNIEISGFVHRDDSMKNNEFVVGRNLMSCCAADMQMVGVLCSAEAGNNINDGTWVKVTGTVNKLQGNKEVKVVVKVLKIEVDTVEDKGYIYTH